MVFPYQEGGPKISHSFFANDCHLFFTANSLESMVIKEVLTKFYTVLG